MNCLLSNMDYRDPHKKLAFSHKWNFLIPNVILFLLVYANIKSSIELTAMHRVISS